MHILLACKGRVVVSGMGKSGHIARKIAATLASTGTPAFHCPPGRGQPRRPRHDHPDDVLIAISNSGESAELLAILPLIKRQGAKLIALTGNPASTLGREADVHLDAGVAQEACPLNLAPTASTTAALALGDALAVATARGARLHRRGFRPHPSRRHPGPPPAHPCARRHAHAARPRPSGCRPKRHADRRAAGNVAQGAWA